MLSQFVPDAVGMGMNTINDLFNGVRPLDVLLILLVAKTLAVFVSANIGFAGGFLAQHYLLVLLLAHYWVILPPS